MEQYFRDLFCDIIIGGSKCDGLRNALLRRGLLLDAVWIWVKSTGR